MTYELAIHPEAEDEWAGLNNSIKQRFKQKLIKERLIEPRVPKDKLRELSGCHKIKLTTPQFRLVYYVNDTERLVTIVSIASRDDVYRELKSRLL